MQRESQHREMMAKFWGASQDETRVSQAVEGFGGQRSRLWMDGCPRHQISRPWEWIPLLSLASPPTLGTPSRYGLLLVRSTL